MVNQADTNLNRQPTCSLQDFIHGFDPSYLDYE